VHPYLCKISARSPFATTQATLAGKQEENVRPRQAGHRCEHYFKLLKRFIIFFLLFTLTACPLYYFYSSDNMSQQATETGQLQAYLSK